MDKISVRQICFLFLAMMPLTKLILYPATVSYWSANDLLLSAALNFVAEGAILALLLLLTKKTEKTFFDLLRSAFGKIGAKIVYGIFALYFAFSALLPVLEHKGFVLQILYENVPSILSFVPLFGVTFFACIKGFKTIGRTADLAMPIFLLSFLGLLFLSVMQADYSALLPIAAAPPKRLLQGSLFGLPWYGDSLCVLFFLGHFRNEKHTAKKILFSFGGGAVATLLFLATFYGIYADIAVKQQNALAHISKYTTAYTSLGRIDLFFVFALTLVSIFYLCVPLQLSVHCVRKIFDDCNPVFPSAALNLAFLVLVIVFNYSYLKIQTLYTQRLWWIYLIFCYALPALSLFLLLFRRKDKTLLRFEQTEETENKNAAERAPSLLQKKMNVSPKRAQKSPSVPKNNERGAS